MKINNEHIELLLTLFMQGETTLDQERELSQFFAGNQDIPEEWAPYREMMAYFDDGMPLEVAKNPKRNIIRTVWTMVAAAAAAIIIMVLPNIVYSPQPFSPKAKPVVADGGDIPKANDTIMPSPKHIMAKIEKEKTLDVKIKTPRTEKNKNTTLNKAKLNAAEIERERGEIEQTQQELLADQYIIEQERQEILDEQYAGRAQVFQAQQSIKNDNPQFLQVVFK